jgi:hypothetical protein
VGEIPPHSFCRVLYRRTVDGDAERDLPPGRHEVRLVTTPR